MGVLGIGVTIGLVFGLAFGVLLVLAKQNLHIRGRTGFFILNPQTGESVLKWVKLRAGKPIFKHDKAQHSPVLKNRSAYNYRSRPMFFYDETQKEVFDPTPGKLEEPWPNAEDRALAYKSIREKNMARAPHNDQTEWAKYGAMLGAVSVLLLVIIAGLMWKTFGGFL